MFTADRMFEVLGLLYLHQLFSSGTADLPPPCNVSFVSENFQHALKWEAGDPGSVATNYTVEYMYFKTRAATIFSGNRDSVDISLPRGNGEVWQATQNCSHISTQMCNLTNEFGDFSAIFFVRVKAITEAEESNWTITEDFQPRRDTNLRPVNVHLVGSRGAFKINFDFATPPTIIKNGGIDSLLDIFGQWKYHIIIARNGTIEEHRDLQGSTDEQSVSKIVEDVEASTNYCVTIKIFSSNEKPSNPSEKRCIVTHPVMDSGESLWLWMLFSTCLLCIGLLIFIITLCKGGFLGCLTKYIPQSLSNLKQVSHVYNYSDVEENISNLDHVALNLNYLNENKMNIQEDNGTELISSDDEDGYEPHSLPVKFQKNTDSENPVETDEASFKPFDDQPTDEFTEEFCTHPNDYRIVPTEAIHSECEGSETKSQVLTDPELSSSAAAGIDIVNISLCSVQIEDMDRFFGLRAF
ncbi:interferon alpha/beta receptor 2 [Callorhinchus milii]|uniref:Uncharacterized LOC103186765 n=1 Tax=Callorhinchus milii TaxID=7868 RepID=A0A4W3J7X3_CALMI|nr:interferon alpha/beta receptor 2 [Callorhinchus milii]|eukprot:gi/632975338/ref/XP_007904173.1/ PREDICTED: uncharacterized protein LOC103186765 [Callorhinchus milii]